MCATRLRSMSVDSSAYNRLRCTAKKNCMGITVSRFLSLSVTGVRQQKGDCVELDARRFRTRCWSWQEACLFHR